MEKIIRVAAYARVSTDKDDQANSLVSQKGYFSDYITNHEGWQLKQVYYDEGITGTNTKKRTGFNQMINDAMSGEIDLILTKEVSRFARNTVDTLSYTRKLKDDGVGVIFTIDNIDTRDPDGELRLTIMASIAQEESRKTSERVKWGQKRQMEKGVVFGRDMLGYNVNKGVLSINEEEAPIVRTIFNKYTNEGKGTWTIARELLNEGMRPKRYSLWSNTVILRVLRNEKYVGDLCQKKTITPNYLTHSKKYNRGDEEMIYIKDHHEPIIDRDLWDRTQAELKRRAPSAEQKSKYSNRYWCSGKIRCAECGNRYVSRVKNKKTCRYVAWRCYSAANYGKEKLDADGKQVGCDNGAINEKALLYCMGYCINLISENKSELKKEILREIDKIKKTTDTAVDVTKIKNQIEKVQAKKSKILDMFIEELITKQEFTSQKEMYDSDLERLNKQLFEAMDLDKMKLHQIDEMQMYIQAIDDILDFKENDELLFKEILDHIDIHKDKVLDIWLNSIPFGIRIKIKTSGKLEHFKTEVIETNFIEK